MTRSTESNSDKPDLPEYLAYVMKENDFDEPVRASILRKKGRFGMSETELARLLKVTEYLSILKFTYKIHQNISHTPQPHLNPELFPSLAALGYLLYDPVCGRDPADPKPEKNFAELYTRAVGAMPDVRRRILRHPDLIALYPIIESGISDPTPSITPNRKLITVIKRFDPSPYINGSIS